MFHIYDHFARVDPEDDMYLRLKKQIQKIDLFMQDPTIEIFPAKNIKIHLFGANITLKFRVFEYKPRFRQPCYVNQTNPFLSIASDKLLLGEQELAPYVNKCNLYSTDVWSMYDSV